MVSRRMIRRDNRANRCVCPVPAKRACAFARNHVLNGMLYPNARQQVVGVEQAGGCKVCRRWCAVPGGGIHAAQSRQAVCVSPMVGGKGGCGAGGRGWVW